MQLLARLLEFAKISFLQSGRVEMTLNQPDNEGDFAIDRFEEIIRSTIENTADITVEISIDGVTRSA